MKYSAIALACLLVPGCMSPGGSSRSDRPPLDLDPAERIAPDTCSAEWVAGVRGRIVDESGAPVQEAIVQMCLRMENGSQLCQAPRPLVGDGYFAVVLPEETRCVRQVTLRATQVHQPVSTTFCRVPMTPVYGVLDVWDDLVLHRLETPVERPPMGDEGQMRTVRFPSGLEMDVTPGDFEFPDAYEDLTAGPIPVSAAPCFADGVSDLRALWAFGPESGIAPAVPLRIPETTGLPDGTRVELWLVGGTYTTLPSGANLEEGLFEPYGTATVSGAMIAGGELPYLSWIGYRTAD